MAYWTYLNLGVIVAVIGLGVIAIDKALENSTTVESKLSVVNTTVKMTDAVVATKGNTPTVGKAYSSASISVNLINPKGLNPDMGVQPTTISNEKLAAQPELVGIMDKVKKSHDINPLYAPGYQALIPVAQADALMQSFSFKDVSHFRPESSQGVKTYISLVTVDNVHFYVIVLRLV